ncbi:hypothetical protein B0T17DRAFT_542955 [Bombardia bombarda]|uniref:Autophagy-related protein 29 n=1 Tax=Bombardia bombarda TaxID=252184 RepID=A0AA39TUV3_9PEZI|nr:hypothetical protein B0T17DRAFT_542955 [Bombardia bombarda]
MASREKRRYSSTKEKREPKYHVFVRLPFNRGDFVDPPPLDWDERKSEALWGVLSGVSQTDIDWNALAAKFDVTVEFLLQMVSYLTELHTSQLRAQIRKAAAAKSSGSLAPSAVPGAEPSAVTAEAMRRTGPGGGPAPSVHPIRKDSLLPKNDKTSAPKPPQVPRNSSASTAVVAQKQSQNQKQNLLPATKTTANRLSNPPRRRLSSLNIVTTMPVSPLTQNLEDASPGPADSDSSESSSSESSSESSVQNRIIRRPPRFHLPAKAGDGEDDDDEVEPAFLPFRTQQQQQQQQRQWQRQQQQQRQDSAAGSSGHDLGATLRGYVQDLGGRRLPKVPSQMRDQSQTSDSSTNSATIPPRRSASDRNTALGPLSPRRTAELAGRSSGKGKGISREGSEGTPSMGSSFSDLDDASVTQSALEEALASRMQDDTISSRMSTIGQAFRSRYLPKSNRP